MAGEDPAPILVTPLATIAQLEQSSSQLDGIPPKLEESIRFEGCRLTQAAGALLHLPQDIVARAIITFTRFFTGPEGGSFREYGTESISAASLHLITKISALPKTSRSIVNVYAYLAAHRHEYPEASPAVQSEDAEAYFVSEGVYLDRRKTLMQNEMQILRTLGFQLHIALPHNLCVNYLQTLEVFYSDAAPLVAKRALAHMNTLLLSPQLVYLTHPPTSIAVAAIYLAARELLVKLPEDEWWDVFDTDREELGFLVVAITSMQRFAAAEKEFWRSKNVPLSVDEVEDILSRLTTDQG